MNRPFLSILMPVKNTGKFTKKAIESILEQTYDNFELLILDSSDDNITPGIIKSFSDNRIKYFYRPELNLPQILNYGIEIAGGEFIARMDGDDISMSDRISIEMNYLLSHPETDITGTQFYYIDEYDKILYRKKPARRAQRYRIYDAGYHINTSSDNSYKKSQFYQSRNV
jgi:Glycosyltransferases involved in cell wall biogenesis